MAWFLRSPPCRPKLNSFCLTDFLLLRSRGALPQFLLCAIPHPHPTPFLFSACLLTHCLLSSSGPLSVKPRSVASFHHNKNLFSSDLHVTAYGHFTMLVPPKTWCTNQQFLQLLNTPKQCLYSSSTFSSQCCFGRNIFSIVSKFLNKTHTKQIGNSFSIKWNTLMLGKKLSSN